MKCVRTRMNFLAVGVHHVEAFPDTFRLELIDGIKLKPAHVASELRTILAGGEVARLPVASKNPLTILANAGRLTYLIESRKVDLIHARSRAPAWSALLAARRTGRPFVTTYHGAYGEAGPFKAAYNSVMGRGDRVIANSLYTADLISSRQRIARDRIRVIYRGVERLSSTP